MTSPKLPCWLVGAAATLLSLASTTSAFTWLVASPVPTSSSSQPRHSMASTHCFICSVHTERRGVEIPLLDVLDQHYNGHDDDDDDDNTLGCSLADYYVQPLPSTHLPDDMTTLHVYAVETSIPLHRTVLEYAVAHAQDWIGEGLERSFGHIAWKPSSQSLVGAIGCAAEVLGPSSSGDDDDDDDALPTTLCRGTYRFIVREIKQIFPFPIAIVDELTDDATLTSPTEIPLVMEEDDSDEEENDDYAHLTGLELVQRTMQAMQTHVEQQLDVAVHEMSPLERKIVAQDQERNMLGQRRAAQEMAAVWKVFQQYLLDLCPSPTERCFTIGFMAAEMANLSNDVRHKILRTTNGLERLRLVLRELENVVGMTRARRLVHSMTQPLPLIEKAQQQEQGDGKETTNPPCCISTIRKGTRVEYLSREECEWEAGVVLDDPVLVVNEYIITVQFDEDGEIHRLPFGPDNEEQWRLE